MSDRHTSYLRAAIQVAARAHAHGNHPFGAILVSVNGAVLAEAENTNLTERDIIGHVELNLARQASQRFDRATLATTTHVRIRAPLRQALISIITSDTYELRGACLSHL